MMRLFAQSALTVEPGSCGPKDNCVQPYDWTVVNIIFIVSVCILLVFIGALVVRRRKNKNAKG